MTFLVAPVQTDKRVWRRRSDFRCHAAAERGVPLKRAATQHVNTIVGHLRISRTSLWDFKNRRCSVPDDLTRYLPKSLVGRLTEQQRQQQVVTAKFKLNPLGRMKSELCRPTLGAVITSVKLRYCTRSTIRMDTEGAEMSCCQAGLWLSLPVSAAARLRPWLCVRALKLFTHLSVPVYCLR